MSDQTARELEYPTACASCGGRISEPAAYCPHCGTRTGLAPLAEAGASQVSHGAGAHSAAAPAARFEPPMRSFAPTDFEGDLDVPWLDASAAPAAAPDGQARLPLIRRIRQWGFKGGIGLTLVAFIVLYGGVTALHRYDQPSVSPGTEDGVTKSADGSIASNGSNDPNLTAPTNNALGALTPAAPANGAPESALGSIAPPHSNNRTAAAPSRHAGRGRTHRHRRTYAHTHPKRRQARAHDTTYMHVDLPAQPRSTQPRTSLARLGYIPNAFRII
jgi:hypothetical protein